MTPLSPARLPALAAGLLATALLAMTTPVGAADAVLSRTKPATATPARAAGNGTPWSSPFGTGGAAAGSTTGGGAGDGAAGGSTTSGPSDGSPSDRSPSDPTGRAIAGFALVNDVSRKPILGLSPLVDGTVVDLTKLANRHLSLQATLARGVTAGSVAFTLTGTNGETYTRTESTAPYFLCDDFVDCPLLGTPDDYTLTAQAYSGAGPAGGPLGAALTVRFRVSATAVPVPPLEVLFVGNSLIGTATRASGEDTPEVVRRLATAAGRTLRFTEVIHFGNTLRRTWNTGAVTKALNGATRYDYIVLQEHSRLVATDLARASDTLIGSYAPAFPRALKPGGKVVLFKDWALVDPEPFASRAAYVAAIDANYAALATSMAAATVQAPISDGFEAVIATRGKSFLIVPDGKHPNDAAVYLDAVMLYGILFRESPRSLSDLYAGAATASLLRDVAATQIGY